MAARQTERITQLLHIKFRIGIYLFNLCQEPAKEQVIHILHLLRLRHQHITALQLFQKCFAQLFLFIEDTDYTEFYKVHMERLLDITVRPARYAIHTLTFIRQGRQQDNGNMADGDIRFYTAAKFEAIHFRHHHIG